MWASGFELFVSVFRSLNVLDILRVHTNHDVIKRFDLFVSWR